MNKIRSATLIVLLLLVFEVFLGSNWGIHRGLYSLFTRQVLLVTSFAQIGFVLSIYGLTKSVTNLGLGALSDRIGRKPTILLGMILSGSGGAVIALATTYNDMLLGTALIGFGGGSTAVGITVSINESVASNKRGLAMGLFELAAYGGSSLGSALGGYLAFTQNLRLPFFIITAVCGVAAVAGFFVIIETKGTRTSTLEKMVIKNRGKAFRRSIPLNIAGFGSKIMDSLIWSFLPLYVIGLGMSIVEVAAITSTFTLSWALVQPLAGYLSDKLGRRKIVLIGLACTAVGILLYTLIHEFVLVLALSLILGFGGALFYTPLLAMVGDIAPPGLEGTLIGSYRFFRDMGYFVGPLILGTLADTFSLNYSFYFTSVSLFITIAVVCFSRETLPKST